jgi:hypothetical protein
VYRWRQLGKSKKAADLAIKQPFPKMAFAELSQAYDFFFFAEASDFEPSLFEFSDFELSDLVSFFSSFLPPVSLESPLVDDDEPDPAEDFLA